MKKTNNTNGTPVNRLTQLRNELHLSQQDLSEKLHIEPRTISRMENGVYTIQNLILFADFYKVSLDYILMRSDVFGNERDGLGETDVKILKQIEVLTPTEKEHLLKHLELENLLNAKNSN